MAEEGERVRLHVYDLSQGLARQLSAAFLGKTIEAIWHTGVVVYGEEFYFGGGIQRNGVGESPYGTPLRVVELGYTQVPKELFEEFLEGMGPRYTAETYSLMYHNCNNFSEEVAQFLVGTSIPQDILRLPQEVMSSPTGALIMPMIQSLETTLRNGGVPQVPQMLPGPMAGTSPAAARSVPPPASPITNARVSGQPSVVVTTPAPPKEIPKVKPAELAGSPAKSKEVVDVKASGKEAVPVEDPLGDARAKVQEEITREFSAIMAAGSLSASEAAALATRKVMERYGSRVNLQQSSQARVS